MRTPNWHLKLYLHSIVVAKRLEERIWTNGVASRIVFPPEISVTRAPVHDGTIVSPASVLQLVHPGTGALLHVERVIYSSRRPILAQGHFGSDTTLWLGAAESGSNYVFRTRYPAAHWRDFPTWTVPAEVRPIALRRCYSQMNDTVQRWTLRVPPPLQCARRQWGELGAGSFNEGMDLVGGCGEL